MSKINKAFNTISIGIILITLIGISGTFLSDYLVSINWFGDQIKTELVWDGSRTEDINYWGARHYWYNWSLSILVISSVVRLIVKFITIIEETDTND